MKKRKNNCRNLLILFLKKNDVKNDKKEEKKEEKKNGEESEEEDEDENFLIFLIKKDNKDKMETTNIIIFCEFVKEYICSISHKHKFEGLIENLYGLYCDELNESEHYEE